MSIGWLYELPPKADTLNDLIATIGEASNMSSSVLPMLVAKGPHKDTITDFILKDQQPNQTHI